MNIKSRRTKTCAFIFFLLFFLVGCILLYLYFSNNISSYASALLSTSDLPLLHIYFLSGLSAMAVSILFLILYSIQIKFEISVKIFVFILITVLLSFVSFNVVNYIKDSNTYESRMYFPSENPEFYENNVLLSDEEMSNLFPYYDYIEEKTGEEPFCTFSSEQLENTTYKITQLSFGDYDKNENGRITAEYFESDKSHFLSKFVAEKSFHYAVDNNGEILNSSLIKHETYNDIEYDIIEQQSSKMILISTNSYCFMFHYQESGELINWPTQEFKEAAFKQLDFIKSF